MEIAFFWRWWREQSEAQRAIVKKLVDEKRLNSRAENLMKLLIHFFKFLFPFYSLNNVFACRLVHERRGGGVIPSDDRAEQSRLALDSGYFWQLLSTSFGVAD